MDPPTASANSNASLSTARDQLTRPQLLKADEINTVVRPLAAMDWENGKLCIVRDYSGRGYREEEEVAAGDLIKKPLRYLLPNSDVVIEGIHLNTPRDRSNAQIYWLEELEALGENLDHHDIRVWLFPHRLSYKYEEFALPSERATKEGRNGKSKLIRNKKYDYRFLLRYCQEHGLPTKRWYPPSESERELRKQRSRLRGEISDMANLLRTSGARGIHPEAVEIYDDFLYRVARIGPDMTDEVRDYFAMKVRPMTTTRIFAGNAGWMYPTRRESVLKVAYACVFNKQTKPRYTGSFSTRYITAMAGLSEHGCTSHMRSTILGGDMRGRKTDKQALKNFAEVLRLFSGTRPIESSGKPDQPHRRV